MGKNKYTSNSSTSTSTEGQKRGRENYTKSGKKAARREQRRLEAIARQVSRIQKFESLEKPLVEWLDGGEKNMTRDELIVKAKLTLQQIRGGVPHSQLKAAKSVEVKAETPAAPAEPKKGKVSKYRNKKAEKSSAAKSAIVNSATGQAI